MKDRNGHDLALGTDVHVHYDDGTHGEGTVSGFDVGAEDGYEVEVALDGGVVNNYAATDLSVA